MKKFELKIQQELERGEFAQQASELYQAAVGMFYCLINKEDFIIKELGLDAWDAERVHKFMKLMERLTEFDDSE